MFVEEKEVGEVRELDDAAKLLLKAADIIESRGLWKDFLDNDGICAVLAIGDAEGYTILGPVGAMACERLATSVGWRRDMPSCTHVYKWNDAPERTKEEVVAKLRAVALGG